MSDRKPQTKIAYLTGEYPRATDTFIQREVAGLRDLGLDVITCSIRKTSVEHLVGDEQRQEAANTFYILQAASNPMRLAGVILGNLVKNPRRFLKTLALSQEISPAGLRSRLYHLFYFIEALVLAAHLRNQGVTHLHNHIAKASCTVALLASKSSGIPYSFTLHGPDIFFEPHFWRLDAKIDHAKFVACISNFCRSQAMIFSQQTDWPKLHIVHCGVDPNRYDTETKPVEKARKNLLFVGRLAAVKGVPVLFQAMADLKDKHGDIHLTLIGDGPERAELEQQANRLGLAANVDFLGYKSQSDVAVELARTDILVLPSFAEGVPVVLMEAMAAKVPVITSHIAGIPELVTPDTGILTPPGDLVALKQALCTLLENPTKRVAMGQAGSEKIQAEFNIARETKWLSEILSTYEGGGQPPVRNVS